MDLFFKNAHTANKNGLFAILHRAKGVKKCARTKNQLTGTWGNHKMKIFETPVRLNFDEYSKSRIHEFYSFETSSVVTSFTLGSPSSVIYLIFFSWAARSLK